MARKYTNMELMDKVPVTRAILTLALPTILSQTVNLMYSLFSSYYLGLMGQTAAYQQAAVTLSMPITMVVQAVGNIFALGTPPYMSRKLGAKDYDAARTASSVSFWSALACVVFTTLLFFIIREPLLGWIGTDANTIGPTRTYLNITTGLSCFSIMMIALSGTLRSEGATIHSMIGIGSGALLNIGVTPLFIFVFDMGIAGAAWATVLCNAVSFCYMVQLFLRKKTVLSISPKYFKFSWPVYRDILKFGLPAAANNVLTSFTQILANNTAQSIGGPELVAAYGIGNRVYQIAYMVTFGFCSGYQPFAAYNYGAKNYKRMFGAFKVSMIFSTILGVILCLLFVLIPGGIVGIFSDNPDVIVNGTRLLRMLGISVPFLGCMNTFLYTLQGLNRPGRSLVISVGR